MGKDVICCRFAVQPRPCDCPNSLSLYQRTSCSQSGNWPDTNKNGRREITVNAAAVGDNYDQLVAVLAHEVAHYYPDHHGVWMKNTAKTNSLRKWPPFTLASGLCRKRGIPILKRGIISTRWATSIRLRSSTPLWRRPGFAARLRMVFNQVADAVGSFEEIIVIEH